MNIINKNLSYDEVDMPVEEAKEVLEGIMNDTMVYSKIKIRKAIKTIMNTYHLSRDRQFEGED